MNINSAIKFNPKKTIRRKHKKGLCNYKYNCRRKNIDDSARTKKVEKLIPEPNYHPIEKKEKEMV